MDKELKKIIRRNMYLTPEFKKERVKGKIFKTQTIYYLIGIVPLAILYDGDDKQERININPFIKVERFYNELFGVRAGESKKIGEFEKPLIDELVNRAEKIVGGILRKKEFKGKKVKNFIILNFHKDKRNGKKEKNK